MKNYCIDSDILIYFLKGNQKIIDKFIRIPSYNLYITRINYTELLYGAYNSERVKENLKKITLFLEKFNVLEYDKNSADIFAKLKSDLKKEGKVIADMDLMIASIALANNQTLVTNNLKHFQRIKKLKIERWI